MSKLRQQMGPEPAPRPELGPMDGHAAPSPGNPPRPAQAAVGGNRDARAQLAQGQYPVDQSARLDGAGSLAHLAYGAPMPAAGVTLRMHSPHPENPGNRGVNGGTPEVHLQVQEAARAAVAPGHGHPDDFAQPPGAMGLASPAYTGDYHTATTNAELPAFVTPVRPDAPAAIDYRRQAGELQAMGRPEHQRPPGWQYADVAPGDLTILGPMP